MKEQGGKGRISGEKREKKKDKEGGEEGRGKGEWLPFPQNQ